MHLYQKYAPNSLKEFAGNPSVVEEVRTWALLFENNKIQKPLLISGPPGVGKTALAIVLAKEMGWEILELNSSDTRNKNNIEKIIGGASGFSGLFSRFKLILIDEADNFQGNADRGGIVTITRIIEESKQPMILTANDVWDPKLATVRNSCKIIDMKRINKNTIKNVLEKIANEEEIIISDEDIIKISENCDGDLRSAIIDLQSKTTEDLRNRDKVIFECMKDLFNSKDFDSALNSFQNTTLDHDMIKLWVEQNICLEYLKPEELAYAYNYMSRADVFDGRILKRQEWKLLKYSNSIMLTGVGLARDGKNSKYVKHEFPSYLRSMSLTARKRATRKKVLKKISEKCHVSINDANLFIPLIQTMIKKTNVGFFDFEEDEVSYISKI
ncbi:MAG: replication factor C large subunit [Bacteroidales bacterium]|nr:replication factor C large subunit [Bacteroidales bacterium]